MSDLCNSNLADAKDHPVLDRPYSYDIVGFEYSADSSPYGTLDLRLRHEQVELTLRFSGVHDLEIDRGFPHSYYGLEILDVAHFGWEHTKIRVQGYEEDAPGIRFWAQSVVQLGA